MTEYEGIVQNIRCLDQDSNYSIISLAVENTLVRIGGYFLVCTKVHIYTSAESINPTEMVDSN